jgi:hypothetical protein
VELLLGNKKKQNKNLIIFVLAAVLISFAIYTAIGNNEKQQAAAAEAVKLQAPEASINDGGSQAVTEQNGDIAVSSGELKILKSEITDKAKFYPYEADGVYMEVLAVKANDGSIRTALNTCQICFNSGQGYYKQEGNKLVCQNCGNRFGVDDVEIVRGGCNPVPILEENKNDDGEYITIDKGFLADNKDLFIGWKR